MRCALVGPASHGRRGAGPLTNFTDYAKGTTERIANNARKLATDAGRLVISFDHIKTRNRVQQKDDLAKRPLQGRNVHN